MDGLCIEHLVDGDHVISYHNESKNELLKLFNYYSRVITYFGNEKSYAIAVTKIDQYRDISGIREDSQDAKEIELNIFDIFYEIPTFKEIVHMAIEIPIYLYTISVDATMKPINKEEEETQMMQKPLKINPWRVKEIEPFSL